MPAVSKDEAFRVWMQTIGPVPKEIREALKKATPTVRDAVLKKVRPEYNSQFEKWYPRYNAYKIKLRDQKSGFDPSQGVDVETPGFFSAAGTLGNIGEKVISAPGDLLAFGKSVSKSQFGEMKANQLYRKPGQPQNNAAIRRIYEDEVEPGQTAIEKAKQGFLVPFAIGEDVPPSRKEAILYKLIMNKVATPDQIAEYNEMQRANTGAGLAGGGASIALQMAVPTARLVKGAPLATNIGRVLKAGAIEQGATLAAKQAIKPDIGRLGEDVKYGVAGAVAPAGLVALGGAARGGARLVGGIKGMAAAKKASKAVQSQVDDLMDIASDTTADLAKRSDAVEQLSRIPGAPQDELASLVDEISALKATDAATVGAKQNLAGPLARVAEAKRGAIAKGIGKSNEEEILKIRAKAAHPSLRQQPEAPTITHEEILANMPKREPLKAAPPPALQAAGGATVGAGSELKAQELEAQAAAETDPDKKAALQRQALMWRGVGGAALAGTAFAGLKIGGGKRGPKAKSVWSADVPDWVQPGEKLAFRRALQEAGGDEVRAGVTTLLKSDAITDETKEALQELVESGDPSVLKTVISHVDRLDKTAQRVAKAGGVSDPENLAMMARDIARKKPGGMENEAQSVVDRIVLMKQITKTLQDADIPGEIRQELLDAQSDLALKYIERGSRAGQMLNAHLLVKKLSPEGLVLWGQKVLNQVDAGLKLSPQAQEKLLQVGQRVADGDIQALETARSIIAAEVPKTGLQKLASLRYLAMLSSPSTHVRNIIGNVSNAALDVMERGISRPVDKAVSLVTGQRSIVGGGDALRRLATAKQSFKPSFKRAWSGEKSVLQSGAALNPEGVGKYSEALGNQQTFKGVMKYPEKVIRAGLQAPDEITLNQAFLSSVVNDLKAQAYNKGIDWEPPKDLFQKAFPGGDFNPKALKAALPKGLDLTEDILGMASKVGSRATFTDDNLVTGLATNLRHALDVVGVGTRGSKLQGESNKMISEFGDYARKKDLGVGSVLMPFVGVPGSITNRVLEHAPGTSFVPVARHFAQMVREKKAGEITQLTQRKFVEALTRAGVGGAAVIGGIKLYDLGLIEGSPDAKGKREGMIARGRSAGSVNASGMMRAANAFVSGDDIKQAAKAVPGDIWVKTEAFDAVNPVASGAAAGVEAMEAPEQAGGMLETGMAAASGIVEAIEDRSFLTGVKTLMQGQGLGGGIMDVAKGAAASFVPAFLSRIASASDGVQRNAKTAPGGTAVGNVMSRIPGLREQLPAAVDFFGQDKAYDQPGNTFLAVALGLINPARIGIEKDRPEIDVAETLTKKTGEESYPTDVQGTLNAGILKAGNGTFKISGEQAAELQRRIGAQARDLYASVAKEVEANKDDPAEMVKLRRYLDSQVRKIIDNEKEYFASEMNLEAVEK